MIRSGDLGLRNVLRKYVLFGYFDIYISLFFLSVEDLMNAPRRAKFIVFITILGFTNSLILLVHSRSAGQRVGRSAGRRIGESASRQVGGSASRRVGESASRRVGGSAGRHSI